jgi:hypothetical protein
MRWTESIYVDRPVDVVFGAVLDQNILMQWSAWPEATGYSCSVDGDGRSVGSSIVFVNTDGVEQGRQWITGVEGRVVRNKLRNQGPRGTFTEPTVDFRVEPEAAGSRVFLDFDITPPVPRPMRPLANLYLKRKVRPLHIEDLRRLKSLVESG